MPRLCVFPINNTRVSLLGINTHNSALSKRGYCLRMCNIRGFTNCASCARPIPTNPALWKRVKMG